MKRQRPVSQLFLCELILTTAAAQAFAQVKPGRDPNQPVDELRDRAPNRIADVLRARRHVGAGPAP